MAYTPTVWETGDVITAAKLNKAEQGIATAGSAAIKVPIIYDENDSVYTVADPSAAVTAFEAGSVVILYDPARNIGAGILYGSQDDGSGAYYADILNIQRVDSTWYLRDIQIQFELSSGEYSVTNKTKSVVAT